ncbi:hypothetical protein DAEQUDRAFT_327531 [Daedalea quercina L-15889]|uniref:Uncharacterized protein n=1 Tax=Daedalea quercina L-15889 TaxID=1314783 RepID=A0A165PPK9_9APHY|nr:hypothetical protein DAEQUDRAFT_327531 [Daedalea quercina L-15889]
MCHLQWADARRVCLTRHRRAPQFHLLSPLSFVRRQIVADVPCARKILVGVAASSYCGQKTQRKAPKSDNFLFWHDLARTWMLVMPRKVRTASKGSVCLQSMLILPRLEGLQTGCRNCSLGYHVYKSIIVFVLSQSSKRTYSPQVIRTTIPATLATAVSDQSSRLQELGRPSYVSGWRRTTACLNGSS